MASPIAPVASAEAVASPAVTGNQAEITPSPGVGSAETPPVSSPESPNIRQLREQYETLKRQYEPYQSLGKPEEIQSQVAIAQKLVTTAVELGTSLGYEEAQIRESLAEDPDGTIAFLRNKQAEADKNNGQTPDIKKLLKEELARELKPFQQEREQRLIEKAHSTFDTAFDAQIAELFKEDKPANDELDELYDRAFRIVERNPEIIKQLKEGKGSGIAQIVQAAKTSFDKAYLARYTRETKGLTQPKAPGQQQAVQKVSLEDMIQGNFPDEMKLG
jgi:hypothetical protein